LRLDAPLSGLYRAPSQQIEDAGSRGDVLNVVAAEGPDIDTAEIVGLRRSRAIVGFHDRAVVVVIHPENTPFRIAVAAIADVASERRISKRRLHPAPSVGLEDT